MVSGNWIVLFGFLPILIGLLLFKLMMTRRTGAGLLARQIPATTPSLEPFLARIGKQQLPRAPGIAVFFTGRIEQTPPALQQFATRIGVLRERSILLTVVVEPLPPVEEKERCELTSLEPGFCRVVLRFGFLQRPNVPSAPGELRSNGTARRAQRDLLFCRLCRHACQPQTSWHGWLARPAVRLHGQQYRRCDCHVPRSNGADDEGRPAGWHLTHGGLLALSRASL